MRIQHNIPAMNSLTNYSRNNNALAGNLEKLSSGYRINSAADDAAGLAISEKMRSQIKGLEKAYDNANDGISLVQTAEGALTEVNSMLTRLKELATQSANGTYQDDVDRENIQQETDALLAEIDRISKATNFNGRNLLDGTLGGSSAGGASGVTGLDTVDIDPTKGKYTAAAAITPGIPTLGSTYEYTISYKDNSGADKQKVVSFKITDATANAVKAIDQDGKEVSLNAADGTAMGTAIQNALKADKEFSANFDATSATGTFTFDSKVAGANGAKITGFSQNVITSAGVETITGQSFTNASKAGTDGFAAVDLSKAKLWDGNEKTLADSIFEIGGEKFVFIKNGTTIDADKAALLKQSGIGNNYVIDATANGTAVDDGDVGVMLDKIKAATGLDVSMGAAAGGVWTGSTPPASTATGTVNVFVALKGAASNKSTGGGLTLQIGDTNNDFNQVTVTIANMSSEGIGIGGLKLDTLENAAASIDRIKEAVNTVAKQRGALGALQNRLDHTLNNLEATTENITSSESQIRDVNMAKEMTAYTKNNILAQAAQSMLAQANSMPQGVLQLLQ